MLEGCLSEDISQIDDFLRFSNLHLNRSILWSRLSRCNAVTLTYLKSTPLTADRRTLFFKLSAYWPFQYTRISLISCVSVDIFVLKYNTHSCTRCWLKRDANLRLMFFKHSSSLSLSYFNDWMKNVNVGSKASKLRDRWCHHLYFLEMMKVRSIEAENLYGLRWEDEILRHFFKAK